MDVEVDQVEVDVVEMSMTMGRSGCQGMAAAMGLVLKKGWVPPQGATQGPLPASLTSMTATSPAAARTP